MKYDAIIGLEIHAELKTESKMFCSCKNSPFASKANENVCPICLAHPGSLPVPNKAAIDLVLKTGLAMHCKINRDSKFDRKNYFYPDLPKGYQISQYDLPFCEKGYLRVGGRRIDVTRIHLEEDTGKSIHKKGEDYTLLDFNRAGAPLMELVTEPVIKSAEEARKFCQEFQKILRYLEASSADMEKGEMRCEANISLQESGRWEYKDGKILPLGDYVLNNKVEVKNLNSFRSVERAIKFEKIRQALVLSEGGKIEAETRGFDEKKGVTVGQRRKESSADYRYFPEPDIPPIKIDEDWLEKLNSELPEMPNKKADRFKQQYGLPKEAASVIASDKELASFFEASVSELGAWITADNDEYERQDMALAKATANLIIGELLKNLNLRNEKIGDLKISPKNFSELVFLLHRGNINSSAGQKVLTEMFGREDGPSDLIKEMGLEQIDDEEALEKSIKIVLSACPEQVEQYKNGKVNVIQFLLGKVMAETQGKANPKTVIEMLKKLLA